MRLLRKQVIGHCAVCDTGKLVRLDVFEDDNHWVAHCCGCGQELLQPLPSPEALQEYYDGYSSGVMPDDDVSFLYSHSNAYFQRFIKGAGMESENLGDLRFLEVGFGNGARLLGAAKFGFKAYGVDLDPTAVATVQRRAREYGLVVHGFQGDISAVEGGLTFDIIKASQILEHTLAPFEFLKELFRRQPSGGHLLLECPNNEATFWYVKNHLRKAYDRMNFYKSLKLTEHLSGFTKTSLQLILRKVGYEVIRCEDYALRDPRFHHENLLWYPTLGRGLRSSIASRNSYAFLKSLIPPFDSIASRVGGRGTHLAVLARK
jgi:2-polyprenyl-3-methyl-5-hydroxy-6-metoxy-1,4-benzoquinol methylase